MQLPNSLLTFANLCLFVFTLLFCISVMLSYPLANFLSMQSQIAAHIATIIVAALIKISYVVRRVCQYQLGLEVR
ncbi:hypothetical protein [Pseudoalteromonas xiamenensis]|uniref:Orphan protein n=1 Tax=Pseudoalteromonas xiamenensis TaxID=882626 RepID=A0A975HMW7_9GAMM|nr:hypothetical protein [Pseudoalteromonas xiamenensis]QTH73556.1 hypothetical protein J5O05_18905 [Pseudoalteromonas xiamenensis]